MGKWEGALSVQQDKILIVAKPLPSRCLEIVRARLKKVASFGAMGTVFFRGSPIPFPGGFIVLDTYMIDVDTC